VSGTTSVPRPRWTDTGFLLPTEQDILKGVRADLNACFGGALNPALETPQGQLATTEAAIISDKNDQFLLLTQNVDPAYSQGRMQDGIGRIYFLTRYPALPTTVQATCIGLQGVVIPVGVMALAKDGNFYTSTAQGVIGADGTATVPFECNVMGPISCPTGSLNRVYNVIPGWDAIINNADGVVGQDVETRAQFERRRFNSVAGNSAGMLASVLGAVLNVNDVLDAYVTENFTSSAVTVDGVTLQPHSLYVCVSGGIGADIANAIFTRKAPGCNMAGNTTITVYDTNGGYSPPAPSYPITYQNAAPQTFVMLVTLINSVQVPQDALIQVQNVVLNAWSGADGGSRARIGSTVFASRYYAAVAGLGPWVQLVSIKLGSSVAPAAQFTAAISGTVMTVSAMTTGAIAIGQTVAATAPVDSAHVVMDGTRIVSLGTGTGGVGTYNLNMAPTPAITSEAMFSMIPTLDDVAVGVAHAPVLSAANISIALVSAP
jgi:hypothetical protein